MLRDRKVSLAVVEMLRFAQHDTEQEDGNLDKLRRSGNA